MGNTLNFRTAIQTKLSSYVADTYYRRTKKTFTTGTWLVYDLEDFSYEETYNQVKLEINLMNKGDDSTTIENMADTIWEGLDHWDYIDSNNIGFSCYQNVRNNITEEEPTLNHRRLVFSIRLYK